MTESLVKTSVIGPTRVSLIGVGQTVAGERRSPVGVLHQLEESLPKGHLPAERRTEDLAGITPKALAQKVRTVTSGIQDPAEGS